MAAAAFDGGAVQARQTHYRMSLVDAWQIREGSRVLEIACGQGDMTAVLAEAAGPGGRVTAVDIADPGYGAPVSLGDSAAHLLRSDLGARIEFRFQTDLLDPQVDFPNDAFDVAVLAHGAWYFRDLEQLRQVLRRLRSWAKRLCIAEWSLAPDSIEQVAHMLAVLIQGEIGLRATANEANVRTPFSRERLLVLLDETGWNVSESGSGDTGELQDGSWEVDYCLHDAVSTAASLDLPAGVRAWIASQVELLRELAGRSSARALPSYWVIADRRM
jgi:SAM-dependent methyltransferase